MIRRSDEVMNITFFFFPRWQKQAVTPLQSFRSKTYRFNTHSMLSSLSQQDTPAWHEKNIRWCKVHQCHQLLMSPTRALPAASVVLDVRCGVYFRPVTLNSLIVNCLCFIWNANRIFTNDFQNRNTHICCNKENA